MKAAVVTLAALCCAAVPQESTRPLAIEQFQSGDAIVVTSASFGANGRIPLKHADYGEKVSVEVSWSGVPPSARSIVVLMEDPDAKDPNPFVHWLLYNLPATVRTLPEAVPSTPRLPEFDGALQGRNSRGTTGYFGPRPPKGDPGHRYHLQVFAVDAMLNLNPGATASAVLAGMKGHLVGKGELVGLYQAP